MGVKSERKYKIKIGPRMRLNIRYSHITQLVKNSPAMQETPGSIPGLGRYTGEGIGYPLEYSGLENSKDCIVHGSQRVRYN